MGHAWCLVVEHQIFIQKEAGMFGLPGGIEWIVVLIIVLLLFGKRIPQVMRSVGQGISEFKQGQQEGIDESEPADEDSSPDRLPDGDMDSEEERDDERSGHSG